MRKHTALAGKGSGCSHYNTRPGGILEKEKANKCTSLCLVGLAVLFQTGQSERPALQIQHFYLFLWVDIFQGGDIFPKHAKDLKCLIETRQSHGTKYACSNYFS